MSEEAEFLSAFKGLCAAVVVLARQPGIDQQRFASDLLGSMKGLEGTAGERLMRFIATASSQPTSGAYPP